MKSKRVRASPEENLSRGKPVVRLYVYVCCMGGEWKIDFYEREDWPKSGERVWRDNYMTRPEH